VLLSIKYFLAALFKVIKSYYCYLKLYDEFTCFSLLIKVFLFLQIFKPPAEVLQKIVFQSELFWAFFAAISLKRFFSIIPTFVNTFLVGVCIRLT